MQLADVQPVQDTGAYRACYGSCREGGGEIAGCMEQCGDLMPGDTTVSTPGGPCAGYWECFAKGFEIPEPIRQLPGTIADVVGQVTAPVNTTLLLLAAAAVALAWLRRS